MDAVVSIGIGGTVGLATSAWLWKRHRLRRDARYQRLSSREADVVARHPVVLGAGLVDPRSLANEFAESRMVRAAGFLDPKCLDALREEALRSRSAMERSYVPLHKQGSTLAYEKVMELAQRSWSFYCSPVVAGWLSQVTGESMLRCPVQDQSAISLLCYEREGDHIQWHYDHNFYRGRHFTVLLSLLNRGADGGLARSTLQRRLPGGRTLDVDTSENTLVLFEGACVRHRATPLAAGDLRLILSTTFCADPRISPFKEGLRRLKDTAFFGWRALWD